MSITASTEASSTLVCPLNLNSPCQYITFAVLGPHKNVSTSRRCGEPGLSIPFKIWNSGGFVNISVLLSSVLNDIYTPANVGTVRSVDPAGLVAFTQHVVRDSGELWADVELQYVGDATRGSLSVVLDILLEGELFECSLPTTHVAAPLWVQLDAAPYPISDLVVVAVDTMAVAGVLTPTGLVRGVMLGSVLGMIRCSQFDPDEELSFINNPMGWAVGDSGPRYQRGSAVTVLIIICVLATTALTVIGALIAIKGDRLVAVVNRFRLPSCALPVVLLLSEMGVSSSVTLVLYDLSEGGDVALGVTMLCLPVGYMVLHAVRVLRGKYRIEEVEGTHQSFIQYMLDPSHEVGGDDEQWIRRNFYFVDGRSWPLFGVVEVAAGMVSNILEGVPLTSSAVNICAARPACMLAMSLALLGLLVWRVPNVVRLSQWGAVIVTALLCVCSAAVLVNVVSPSDGAEEAATNIALSVSMLNCFLGLAEVVGMLLAVIPCTVASLSLRSRTLEALVLRGAEEDDNAVPMLCLPATVQPQSPHLQQEVPHTPQASQTHYKAPHPIVLLKTKSKEEEDAEWVQRVITAVNGRNTVGEDI